ncbi:MAG: YceD family protein [Tabrizicola sp.]
MGLQAIPSLIMEGEIVPHGREDFRISAHLKGEVVQSCVVTLAPVPGVIDEVVARLYQADFVLPEGDEVEIPADDDAEPLPEVLDLWAVMSESLALALPLYPRAPGAELGEAVFSAPGTAPLRDADLRPFAALASLARKDDPTSG